MVRVSKMERLWADLAVHDTALKQAGEELAHLIHGMAGIRQRVSRKLLIAFMDWVSKPSIHTITPSHTRYV